METKICKKCGHPKPIKDFHKSSRSKDGYNYKCKLCRKECSEVYYSKNKETISLKSKKYYEDNVDRYQKKHKEYYQNNRDKVLERTKLNQKNNRDILRSREWVKNNPDKVIENKNKLKIKTPNYHTEYISNRKKNDSLFKLTMNIRRRLLLFFKSKNIKKNNKTFEIIGCTPKFLKEYLEKQFANGMNWDNHGEWHIDHKIPLSSANTEEEVYELCYYTNLQPLWAEDNMKKGNKVLCNKIKKTFI